MTRNYNHSRWNSMLEPIAQITDFLHTNASVMKSSSIRSCCLRLTLSPREWPIPSYDSNLTPGLANGVPFGTLGKLTLFSDCSSSQDFWPSEAYANVSRNETILEAITYTCSLQRRPAFHDPRIRQGSWHQAPSAMNRKSQ